MSVALSGGCACGAVRYELKPGFRMKPYACHCTDCQKRTGSAFAVNMAAMTSDFEVEGELINRSVAQPSGAIGTSFGCRTCLSRIFGQNDLRPDLVILRVGTLDDSKNINPAAHFWTKSKQSWVVIPEDVPSLDTQPQSNEEWLQYVGPDA